MPGSTFNKRKELQPDLFESEYPHPDTRYLKRYAIMHCDGASSGNPGNSGIGVVIDVIDQGHQHGEIKETHRISEYIGIATNNVAEYSAFIKGLQMARSLEVERIDIFLDSELLVRQINGIYKVKNKNLLPMWIKAINILKEFDEYRVVHVPREQNREADSLATQAVKRKAGG